MPQLQQAQCGHQGEQGTVGHCPRVVHRIGFAAKSERHRLRRIGARQVVSRIPSQHQHANQQQRKWQTRGKGRIHHCAEQLNGRGTQPKRQHSGFGRQAGDGGRQPRRLALRNAEHVAKRGDVRPSPRVAAEQAWQHISGAKQEQGDPRQALHSALRDQGGIGKVQISGEKKDKKRRS